MEKYESILNQLRQYTADELFYKEYYEVKSSPERLQAFLAQQSREEIIERKLICPELFPEDRSLLYERQFFRLENNRNIWIEKHNRYSPVFMHQHEYFEIFYVLSGSCRHWINNQETTLSQGALSFIAPYVDHSIGVFDDSIILNILIQRTTFDDIFFNVLRANNILSNFFLSNLYTHSRISNLAFQLEDQELIELLLSMLQEEAVEDSYTYRILNNMMSLFFVKLVRKYEQSAIIHISDDVDEGALEIISFINNQYKSVTLEQVADHFNYSLAHCSRLIKAVTGQNFTQLLRNVRMRRAETLLLTTPCSIENISFMVGYENPATFIKLFKQEYKMTPGTFRRKNQLPA